MPLPANRLEVGSGRRSPSRRYHILRAASVMSVWFGVSVVMMVFFLFGALYHGVLGAGVVVAEVEVLPACQYAHCLLDVGDGAVLEGDDYYLADLEVAELAGEDSACVHRAD